MAKKRSRRPRRKERKVPQRDSSLISKRQRALLRSRFIIRDEIRKRPPIPNDRRYYVPHFDDHAKYDDGRRVTYGQVTPRLSKVGPGRLTDRIGFRNPFKVSICRRRRARRESLFARKIIGKGKGVGKIRRMTRFSSVRC